VHFPSLNILQRALLIDVSLQEGDDALGKVEIISKCLECVFAEFVLLNFATLSAVVLPLLQC
jgi:hypothetical protein